MIIEINDSKTIWDIQDKFSEIFPFLKIEFYENPHQWYEASDKKTSFPDNKKIFEIRDKHAHGDLELHSWFKTGDVEDLFKKKFNLNVQVLRLQGTNWIQTTDSDKLTLKEQNEIGRKSTLNQ